MTSLKSAIMLLTADAAKHPVLLPSFCIQQTTLIGSSAKDSPSLRKKQFRAVNSALNGHYL